MLSTLGFRKQAEHHVDEIEQRGETEVSLGVRTATTAAAILGRQWRKAFNGRRQQDRCCDTRVGILSVEKEIQERIELGDPCRRVVFQWYPTPVFENFWIVFFQLVYWDHSWELKPKQALPRF